MNSIFHRTSIRKYTNRHVEDEKIEKILRAAMAAPSAANQQPWRFYVVKNKDLIQKLSQVHIYSGPCETADVCFIIAYTTNVQMPQYVQIDCAIAAENMLLEIDTLGLGGLIMGICPEQDRMEKIKELLQLPDDLTAFAIISCGYPNQENQWKDRYDENKIIFVN